MIPSMEYMIVPLITAYQRCPCVSMCLHVSPSRDRRYQTVMVQIYAANVVASFYVVGVNVYEDRVNFVERRNLQCCVPFLDRQLNNVLFCCCVVAL